MTTLLERLEELNELVNGHGSGPWKFGRDLFGGVHVYDEGGNRITNDRMSGTHGWQDIARLIIESRNALSDLLKAVRALIAIRDADPIDSALDPQWAARQARAALTPFLEKVKP